jgi:hypothetical protein
MMFEEKDLKDLNNSKKAAKNLIWGFCELILKIMLVFIVIGFVFFIGCIIYLYSIGI